MRRTLTLKRETLAELTNAELDAVRGAELPTGETRCPTIPLDYCTDRVISRLVNDTVTCHSSLTCHYTCLCR